MSHTSQPDTRTLHAGSAAAADTKGDAEPEQRKSWALLAVALAAQILVVLDISVVNTALPSIGSRAEPQLQPTPMGCHRLPDDVRWLPTPRRPHRGPPLAPGRVPDRPGPVHCRIRG